MANADKLIPIIRKWEGGWSNNKYDKGKETMCGITLSTFRNFFGKDKTADDLKHITDEQWKYIFKSGYWDKCNADRIQNQSIANLLVDFAWGSGSKTAIKKIQKLLGVKVDGILGEITLSAINKADSKELFENLWKVRKQFFISIVNNNPSQSIFLKGWLNRLNDFRYEEI